MVVLMLPHRGLLLMLPTVICNGVYQVILEVSLRIEQARLTHERVPLGTEVSAAIRAPEHALTQGHPVLRHPCRSEEEIRVPERRCPKRTVGAVWEH